jgi:biopolymer transport protein ExbD
MNFRRGSSREEPEINLIPMIDVLLVILIFLMVTTTFTRFAEIKINLPTAEANKPSERPNGSTVPARMSSTWVAAAKAPWAKPRASGPNDWA